MTNTGFGAGVVDEAVCVVLVPVEVGVGVDEDGWDVEQLLELELVLDAAGTGIG